jgi:hypothetical protein
MNVLVRRTPVGAPLEDAARFFAAYTAGRSVTLLGLVPVPGIDRPLGATARALLTPMPEQPRCSVRWTHTGLTPAPLEFEGWLWLEADRHDGERSWLVLDGEYAWGGSDPLTAIVVRRLSGALARDLLGRVGDFIESGPTRDAAGKAGRTDTAI